MQGFGASQSGQVGYHSIHATALLGILADFDPMELENRKFLYIRTCPIGLLERQVLTGRIWKLAGLELEN